MTKKLGLLGTLAFLLLSLVPNAEAKHRKNLLTPERAATHFITYIEPNEKTGGFETEGICTGTAIGPHALLTANHCDYGHIRLIMLDYSVNPFHILAGLKDKTDHTIYILDGPAFTNYVHVKSRIAKMGEPVVTYGVGSGGHGGDWPPHTYIGKVVVDDNGGDQSDVDAREHATCFNLPVIPGDSGSAIYGADGAIVAIATYGGKRNDNHKGATVGFPLTFDADVLEKIYNLKETQNNGDEPDTDSEPTGDSGAASPNGPPQ